VGGACSTRGKINKILVGGPETKLSVVRPGRRLEGNIKMDVKKFGVRA
jgi:hypothetical protein